MLRRPSKKHEDSVARAEENAVVLGSIFLETSSENDALYQARRRDFLKAMEKMVVALGWLPPRKRTRRSS